MTSPLPTLAITLCVFLNSLNTVGQTLNSDSLKLILSKSSSKKEKCKINLQLGIYAYNKTEFDESTDYLTKALQLATSLNDTPSMIKAHTNLGNIQADKGDNPNAITRYIKGLKLAESSHNKLYTAHLNKNIGALYVSMKRFDESILCYQKAENIATYIKDTLLMADCQNNMGTIYEQQEKYTEAIDCYSRALNYYENYNATDGIAMAYSNLAIVYKLQKNYTKSLEVNQKSLALSQKIGDKWMEAATLNNIGNLYGEQGQFTKAKDYCLKSLAISRAVGAPEITTMVYESLADAAHKVGDFKAAFDYQRMFTKAQDSFMNETNNRTLSELNIKYETEKKENANKKLELENLQTRAQRNLILIIGGLLIAVSIPAYLLMQKNKASKLKIEKMKLVNETVFYTEVAERSRIAQDIHDSIGQKLSVAKIRMSAPKDVDAANVIPLIDDAIVELRTVSHNLMPMGLSKGLYTAIRDLTDTLTYSKTAPEMHLYISSSLENTRLTQQQEVTLYRIIQELVNNSIKHAEAKNIHISMDCHKKIAEILLTDDGKGFETSMNEHSNGLGITSVKNRVAQLGGKLHIESSIQNGSLFRIEIPL